MHARIYDFTLGAGGMLRLPVVGDFFKVISATGQINVNADTGATLDLMPGQGLREFNFNTLTITDNSGAANAGKILVGFSQMIDDRVTGEVSVVDGAAARVFSGRSFSSYCARSAGAGNMPMIQLFNPAASGVDLVVSGVALSIAAGADGWVQLRESVQNFGAAAGRVASKKLGGAASVASLTAQEAPSVVASTELFEIYMGLMRGEYVRMNEPFVLEPGRGIVAVSTVANTLCAAFDFYEKVRDF